MSQAPRSFAERLGYRPELSRSLSGFSNFAVSFSVISILTGGITLYGYGLQTAGPRGIVLGWLLVTLASLPIVLSMAELASAFPTAGALYHWSSILGGQGAGWFTACFNYLGQFAITAGIDYGLTEFLLARWNLPSTAVRFSVYGGVLASHALVNHLGIRWIGVLNSISAWYHIAGTVVLIGILLWAAPLHPLTFLWRASSTLPYPYYYCFCLGLLQAQWTISGYDASGHLAEETENDSREVAKAMISSVVSAGVLGFLMLVAITLAVGNLEAAQAAPNPFIYIVGQALGDVGGRLVTDLCLVAMWFCGLASLTSNSRMLYAFARDGGVPGHRRLSRISPRFQTPAAAIWCSAALAFLLALYSRGYAVLIAISTNLIFASYLLPIWFAWRAQGAGRWRAKGAFQLGRWSKPLNLLAVAWIGFVLIVFMLPPNQLACYATLVALLVLCLLYFFFGRRFAGAPGSARVAAAKGESDV